MLRVPWTAKMTNQEVLEKINCHHRLVMSLEEAIALKHKLKYFGHVMRSNGLEKNLMIAMVEGRRRRGRQKTRWMDGVKEATNKSIEELKEMVQNRHKWRLFIRRVSEGWIRLNAH